MGPVLPPGRRRSPATTAAAARPTVVAADRAGPVGQATLPALASMTPPPPPGWPASLGPSEVVRVLAAAAARAGDHERSGRGRDDRGAATTATRVFGVIIGAGAAAAAAARRPGRARRAVSAHTAYDDGEAAPGAHRHPGAHRRPGPTGRIVVWAEWTFPGAEEVGLDPAPTFCSACSRRRSPRRRPAAAAVRGDVTKQIPAGTDTEVAPTVLDENKLGRRRPRRPGPGRQRRHPDQGRRVAPRPAPATRNPTGLPPPAGPTRSEPTKGTTSRPSPRIAVATELLAAFADYNPPCSAGRYSASGLRSAGRDPAGRAIECTEDESES